MNKVGIKQFYNTKYDAKDPEFWKKIDLPSGPDKEYVCIGVKASNYFMPKETLSEKGPGGGGWILMVPWRRVGKIDRSSNHLWHSDRCLVRRTYMHTHVACTCTRMYSHVLACTSHSPPHVPARLHLPSSPPHSQC